MNRKKALIITYHVKKCKRLGGFHKFITYLEQMVYDIDWVTSPVSITWLLKHNDKENAKNFIELAKGIEFDENCTHVRHFAVPIWIPAKVAKKFGWNIGDYYWASWKKLKRKLLSNYDVILLEGVGCQYIDDIKRDYPSARVLYRPSDLLETFTDYPNAVEIEMHTVELADKTLCVDELQERYFKNRNANAKVEIFRNPLTRSEDIKFLEEYIVEEHDTKSVIYVGVSCIDLDYIEYAAQNNPEAEFWVIGPFEKKSHDNVVYMGSLEQDEIQKYLKKADVGINPIKFNRNSSQNITIGYTRKIINYMTYLMPIVTTQSTNYMKLSGFYNAESKEEFSDLVKKALNTSIEERMSYKESYLRALTLFSEDRCKEEFKKFVEE